MNTHKFRLHWAKVHFQEPITISVDSHSRASALEQILESCQRGLFGNDNILMVQDPSHEERYECSLARKLFSEDEFHDPDRACLIITDIEQEQT